MAKRASWSKSLTMRMQTVEKLLQGRALLARARLPCKKTVPENALLRQVGGRPMVAPTSVVILKLYF